LKEFSTLKRYFTYICNLFTTIFIFKKNFGHCIVGELMNAAQSEYIVGERSSWIAMMEALITYIERKCEYTTLLGIFKGLFWLYCFIIIYFLDKNVFRLPPVPSKSVSFGLQRINSLVTWSNQIAEDRCIVGSPRDYVLNFIRDYLSVGSRLFCHFDRVTPSEGLIFLF